MKSPLRYTLVGDGPSDRCLVPIINWLLTQEEAIQERGFIPQPVDSRALGLEVTSLTERMRKAVQSHPCDLLFVHRDAEREPVSKREEEIRRAASEAELPPHVPVIPVRMTEAWLLIDERAIRIAADNPNGTSTIPLPTKRKLEAVPDPKKILHECLLTASEKRGRRLDQFRRDLPSRVYRVAELIDDFSPLRGLAAFHGLEQTVRRTLSEVL